MAQQWYCRVLRQELGPMPLSDIADMVRQGVLQGDDVVRPDGQTRWRAVDETIELVSLLRRDSPRPPIPTGNLPTPSRQSPPPAYAEDGGTSRRPRSMRWAVAAGGLMVCILLADAAVQAQPARFPLPREIRELGPVWHILSYGPLSLPEYAMLAVDAVVVPAAMAYIAAGWFAKRLE